MLASSLVSFGQVLRCLGCDVPSRHVLVVLVGLIWSFVSFCQGYYDEFGLPSIPEGGS